MENNPPASSGPVVNQTHSGSGHNISAETVNFDQPRFELTDGLMSEVATQLDKGRPVALGYPSGGRSQHVAEKLRAFLIADGYSAAGTVQYDGIPTEQPITVSPDGVQLGGVTLAGGSQVVFVDTRG